MKDKVEYIMWKFECDKETAELMMTFGGYEDAI